MALIQGGIQAESFPDLVTIDNHVVNAEQQTDKEVRAMAVDRAKLSFDGYQENEPPAVKVTSLQVIDHNKEVKE